MLIKVYIYITFRISDTTDNDLFTINKYNLILPAQQTYGIKYDLLNFLLKQYNLKYKLCIEKF
jgi:hypothetical protein